MYKKIVLKLSGEFLSGKEAVDLGKTLKIAEEIAILNKKGIKVGVVIGAGNIFRGRNVIGKNFDRVNSDYIGMIGSLVNGLALKVALDSLKIKNRLESTLNVHQAAVFHNPEDAKKAFDKGEVVILSGGTGLPYFSTDTAAVELSLELNAEILLKGTKVTGVYNKDPKRYRGAKKYDEITFADCLEQKLQVMDQTAFSLAQENKLSFYVFKWQKGVADNIINNNLKGTLVKI